MCAPVIFMLHAKLTDSGCLECAQHLNCSFFFYLYYESSQVLHFAASASQFQVYIFLTFPYLILFMTV